MYTKQAILTTFIIGHCYDINVGIQFSYCTLKTKRFYAKRCSRVLTTFLYLESSGFSPLPRDLLPQLKCFFGLSVPSGWNSSRIGPCPPPSISFAVYCSLIIVSFDAIQSEQFRTSLNKA